MGGEMSPEMPMGEEMGAAPAGRDLEPHALMKNVTPAADLFTAIMRLKQGESSDSLKGQLLGTTGLEDARPEGALQPAPEAFIKWLNEQDPDSPNEVVADLVGAYLADVNAADQLWDAVRAAVADPEERALIPKDLLKIAAQNGASPSGKKSTPAAAPKGTMTAPPMPKKGAA